MVAERLPAPKHSPLCLDAGPLWRSRARGCGVSGANLACVHHHIPRQTSMVSNLCTKVDRNSGCPCGIRVLHQILKCFLLSQRVSRVVWINWSACRFKCQCSPGFVLCSVCLDCFNCCSYVQINYSMPVIMCNALVWKCCITGCSTETVAFQVYEILKIDYEFLQFFWLGSKI